MHDRQGGVGTRGRPDAAHPGEPDRMVDRVVGSMPAAPQRHHGEPQGAGVDRMNMAGLAREDFPNQRRLRQMLPLALEQIAGAAQAA